MLNIFLCGHGQWFPDDGFFTLPRGMTVTFYIHHAKTMYQNLVNQIVSGQYTGVPENVIEEFKNCPNMTLLPDNIPSGLRRTIFTESQPRYYALLDYNEI